MEKNNQKVDNLKLKVTFAFGVSTLSSSSLLVSRDLFVLEMPTSQISSTGLMKIGFSLNIPWTITPLRTCPGAKVGLTRVLWTGIRISKSKPAGIFSSNASCRETSNIHCDHSFCSWKPEMAKPFSISLTRFAWRGTVLTSGPVNNMKSLMNGPLTTDFPFPFPLPRKGLELDINWFLKLGMWRLEELPGPAWLGGAGSSGEDRRQFRCLLL